MTAGATHLSDDHAQDILRYFGIDTMFLDIKRSQIDHFIINGSCLANDRSNVNDAHKCRREIHSPRILFTVSELRRIVLSFCPTRAV